MLGRPFELQLTLKLLLPYAMYVELTVTRVKE